MKKIQEKYYDFAVSDCDGTLLTSNGDIAKETIQKIENFIARGGTFCLCTGRMSASIILLAKSYGLKGYVISFNGAEICDIESGEKIYKNHVDNAACIKLLRYAEQNNRRVQVYPNDKMTVEKLNSDYLNYAGRSGVNVCEYGDKVSKLFEKKGYTSGKVLFYTDETLRPKMNDEIRGILGDNYEIVNSNKEHIDVMAKGVSKGGSVLKLCEIIKKQRKKIICFGDEMNDLSMLEVAALKAVVENGNEKLKSVADVIIPSNDAGGVGIALEKYGI